MLLHPEHDVRFRVGETQLHRLLGRPRVARRQVRGRHRGPVRFGTITEDRRHLSQVTGVQPRGRRRGRRASACRRGLIRLSRSGPPAAACSAASARRSPGSGPKRSDTCSPESVSCVATSPRTSFGDVIAWGLRLRGECASRLTPRCSGSIPACPRRWCARRRGRGVTWFPSSSPSFDLDA